MWDQNGKPLHSAVVLMRFAVVQDAPRRVRRQRVPASDDVRSSVSSVEQIYIGRFTDCEFDRAEKGQGEGPWPELPNRAKWNYSKNLRRAMPARPSRPEPNITSVPGSGVDAPTLNPFQYSGFAPVQLISLYVPVNCIR